MMTLMVIALDRYMVITRPLASLGVMSRRKALSILAITWVYSMGWSLPPFFGWSEYDPLSAPIPISLFVVRMSSEKPPLHLFSSYF